MNECERSRSASTTDHEPNSHDKSMDNRHIKSAPARIGVEQKQQQQQQQQQQHHHQQQRHHHQQQQESPQNSMDPIKISSPTAKTENAPFSPPFVFPNLGMEGERSEGHEGQERSRPTGAVPPSFGQAVHRYYTKDIKRSTSPDPYLYEANLSRIRSFHYQAWLRWMESKKRKQQNTRTHQTYPRPALSPEMRSPAQNLVLDMSTGTTTNDLSAFTPRYDPQTMIDLSKFTRKRKRDELTLPRDKPEDLSRHDHFNNDLDQDTRCRSRSLEDWSTADVVKFVAAIPSCREYAHLFEDQLITGHSLTLLSLDNLTKNLNMKLGPALTLRASVAQLTDQCVQCAHCVHCHNTNNRLGFM